MNHYELLYIIPAKYTEEEIKPIQDTLKKLVEDRGGETVFHGLIGRRKLTYPIKKMYHGYFVTHEFTMDPDVMTIVKEELRVHPEILRYQLVLRPARTVAEATQAFETLLQVSTMDKEEVTDQPLPKEEQVVTVARESMAEPLEAPEPKKAVTRVKAEVTQEQIEDLVSQAVDDVEEIKDDKATVKQTSAPSQEQLTADKDIDMEDIDKKLDELLGGDII